MFLLDEPVDGEPLVCGKKLGDPLEGDLNSYGLYGKSFLR